MPDPRDELDPFSADPLESLDPRELGARLRAARNARGWTQQEAAEHLGVARTTMTAMEKGERRGRPEELIRLAGLYGRKLSELLRPGMPSESFTVQLRGALPPEDSEGSELLPTIRELERLCDDYLELERVGSASLPQRYPPPYPIDGVDPEQGAEDVATAERNRLGLGEGPLLNLRSLLEHDVSLRIFYPVFPSRIAGMFAFTQEYGGVIAVNRSHPPERRRHSLAHEYGHFLTDRYHSEVTLLQGYERRPAGERFAEAFARAFLMPAAGLRRRFHEVSRQRGGRPTPGDVCRLAHLYFVSVEAMTRRLEELGLIPGGTWERLREQGFRVGEAQRLLGLAERPANEDLLPARYRYLAVEGWQRGELSEGQLAAFLRVDRLTARGIVQELGLERSSGDEAGADWGVNLGAPLIAGAAS